MMVHPITLLHILEPLLVLPPALTLLRAPPPSPPELPGIRPIVVRRVFPRCSLILGLLGLLAAAFAGDGLLFAICVAVGGRWDGDLPHSRVGGADDGSGWGWVGYAGAGFVLWGGAALATAWRRGYERRALVLMSGVGVVLESVMLVYVVLDAVHSPRIPVLQNTVYILHLVLISLRILLLLILGWAVLSPVIKFLPVDSSSEDSASAPASASQAHERTGLLGQASNASLRPESAASETPNGSMNGAPGAGKGKARGKGPYGTFGADGANGDASTTGNGSVNPSAVALNGASKVKNGTPSPPPPSELTWSQYFARFARLAPFLWPSKSGKLQLLAVACLVMLVLGRAVNVAVPQVLGRVVGCLSAYAGEGDPRAVCMGGSIWPAIFLFCALRFCQGNGGILSVGQSLLWAPVMQYSDREMSIMCFKHLLDLSLAFHTRRKTGEVLRILDRGSAINNVFQLLLMTLSPVVFDITIACIFFYAVYGWSLALVVAVVMISYFTVSVALTTWRTKLRRQMNERDVITRGIHTDVLMNWESVKYFTAEDRESSRYQDAVNAYQVVEYKVITSLSLLNLTQNFIITTGLLAGSIIVAWRVTKGRASAAEFVVFLTYLGQLYGPLNSLGMIYRSLNSGLVDAEKLLKLLEEEKEVVDAPGANDLLITDGKIEFKDVTFSYDGKVDALSAINFTVEKGESVALVGESGSGKSSLLRLLYRFYDISGGEILIDGQNIRHVTQKSLRKAIGIVPQDAVLWNDTIEFNIGYGKEGASKADIVQAAQAARLHERIMSFPDGYDTVVGERGVRLSGGEKQRVSLARTMLKAPAILVLDEATSALDTETEREVQRSLVDLAKGRSSLMIAHRLSTIVNADKIIVLKNGVIIEVGNHKDLIRRSDGVFAAMWKEQIRSAVEEAQSPEEKTELEAQLIDTHVVGDDAFGGTDEATPKQHSSLANASTSYQDAKSSPVNHADGFELTASTMPAPSHSASQDTVGRNATVKADAPDLGDPEHVVMGMEEGTGAADVSAAVLTDAPTAAAEETQPTTPLAKSQELPSPQHLSPNVPFPSSAAQSPPQGMPSRPSIPHSLSENVRPTSSSSSAASMTRSNSDLESQTGKKDKRKRLSSIGGLVRRVSEQGRQLARSSASPKSPGASPNQELPESPLRRTDQGEPRPKRFSLIGKPKS